ncbi:uncharacterized protein LOC109836386 [Asparagus officinalis]|uniref:uncharacterized protein LOC109836386 n=1 Tax=Asparagus officinalis TaxID=4686 RepID=UPI00098E658E|nr:uncharacterized protein LOC109836386 [Asparagus officinalis]
MPWAAAIRRCERLGGRPGLNGPITRAASKFQPKKSAGRSQEPETQKQNPKPKTQNPNSKVKKSIPKSLTVSPTPPAKGKKSKIVFVASISCWRFELFFNLVLDFRAHLQSRVGASSSISTQVRSRAGASSSISAKTLVRSRAGLSSSPSTSCWTFELVFNLGAHFRARRSHLQLRARRSHPHAGLAFSSSTCVGCLIFWLVFKRNLS